MSLLLQNLEFRPLTLEIVDQIGAWVYEETGEGLFVATYYESHAESPEAMKGPGGCDGYAAYLGEELFGLFEFTFPGGEMEIGCALAPAFKGRGYGAEFVDAGIAFGIARYDYGGLRVLLTVDKGNIAARKVYDRVGFEAINSDDETIRMVKTLQERAEGADDASSQEFETR